MLYLIRGLIEHNEKIAQIQALSSEIFIVDLVLELREESLEGQPAFINLERGAAGEVGDLQVILVHLVKPLDHIPCKAEQ